jgi:ferrous iron transport protein B
MKHKEIHVAVVGCPNSGKSTLINMLAGSKLRVGNWPGVTVEKHEALLHLGDQKIRLVDLPGAYSLQNASAEEGITQQYLLENKPDVILNVVDSTQLERHLGLTLQLVEFGVPVILILNMMDEAESLGLCIDQKALSDVLGVKVVSVIATQTENKEKVLGEIIDEPKSIPRGAMYSEEVERLISTIEQRITASRKDVFGAAARWIAIKYLENDPSIVSSWSESLSKISQEPLWHHIEAIDGEPLPVRIQEERWARSKGLAREIVTKKIKAHIDWTEQIDRIALHPVAGLIAFIGLMWVLFKWTFFFSIPIVKVVEGLINGPFSGFVTQALNQAGASPWAVSLVVEGVIGGVGIVLSFVPLIFLLMVGITFLESSGYMARAAFVMDKWMHRVGLHGKSFIPLVMGFGCNVPAIYATRILESRRDRLLTALIIPLMSCSARIPVYALFVGVFFPRQGATVMWGLYLLGVVLALMMSRLLSLMIFSKDTTLFIMELPPYRMPTWRQLSSHAWDKVKHFVDKAMTYILVASVIIWMLFHFPLGSSSETSYMGQVSQAIAPIFEPLGFGTWQATSALITGVAAKEVIVSTFSQVTEAFPGGTLMAIQHLFTPASALSFLVFVLLYMPCMVTAVAYKQEFQSWRWFFFAMTYEFVLAWIAAFLVYNGALWLM